ncbi:SusC/RagA family TonB-linked outer membrane protein [Pedobacter sp. BS3]|uniref:SusC/RagA family TonB-linked outer membrane protein n=1 Tax=Pedobacter sp. BS3 TaxID=2567937 RepID=UPI0011EC7F20|nr:SusC/RagA family TonB-linked outer membrane protein [Pedobacter sp. BS3]TZF82659.1 SusC/RagA family TonB-linked outer membrane protein [Pedobacter sp. BS3]
MTTNCSGNKTRLKALALMCFLSLSFALNSGLAQAGSGRVREEKLVNVLDMLKKKYHKTFVYEASTIDLSTTVRFNETATSLEEILKQFSAIGIGYEILDNIIVLKKIASKSTAPVQKTIKGRVVTSTNGEQEILAGVIVTEKGTKNTTVTNAAGEFRISVGSNAVLVFTMIGFKPKEVPATDNLLVVLETDVISLNEIVVSDGYQSIDKKLYTGAAATIKGSTVKQEGITDISRMLEGRVAGLNIQNVSGTFGSAPKIRIRGVTSISGDNKPLWVIDGVILEDVVNVTNDQLASGNALTLLGSSVAGINVEDIESFDILQDASATALYGARAMNGVVVINTKKGRQGKPSVSYTGSYSTYLKPSYNSLNIMNSRDQMAVYQSMQDKYYLKYGPAKNQATGGIFTKMANLISTPDANGNFAVENTPEGRASFLQRYAEANTDWFDILFKNSLLQKHSFNVQSGNEKSTNYLSVSLTNDDGWTVGNNLKLYTARNRSTYQFSKKVSLDMMLNGSIRKQRSPGTVNRITNLVLGAYSRDFDINPYSYALSTSRALTAYDENGNLEFFTKNYAPFNILYELDNNYMNLTQQDVSAQAEISYKIIKGLEYRILGSVRHVKTTNEHIIKESANAAEAYRADYNGAIRSANKYLYRDPDDPEAVERTTVLPQGGFYDRTDDYMINYYGRQLLTYRKTFANKHIIDVLAGQEIKYTDRQNSFSNGYGYQYDKGGIPFIDYRLVKKNLESNDYYYGMSMDYDRYVALFSKATYSYNGKYIINGSARYDGSNRMGASRTARWLPTWTVGAAWNADEEPFIKGIPSISYLKIRATYGLTASVGNARNSTVRLGYSNTPRPYADVESSIYIAGLENSDLTWEKQHEMNLGFDIGLFKNKVNFTLDLYDRSSFDLISAVQTSGIGGESVKTANYADLKSHGIAATLTNSFIRNKDVNWSATLTFAYNENRIKNMQDKPRIIDLVRPEGGAQNGYPVSGLYSIVFAGLDHDTGLPLGIGTDGNPTLNINPQSLTTTYLKYEGPTDPTITGGFSSSIRYKELSLAFLISYQAGNRIRLANAFSGTYNDFSAMPNEFLNRWQMPGDEAYTNIPAIVDDRTYSTVNGYPYSSYNYTDIRTVDGGFVRLKNVSVEYAPAKLGSRIGLKNFAVALNATNLWLIYADKRLHGQDPEFYNSGGVASPLAQQFTLSLKVGI